MSKFKTRKLCAQRCTQQIEKEILEIMKNAVIYLVNKNVTSLEEEKSEMITHGEKIPDVKITDIYIEEKPEDRKQLVTQLCEKINKDEVQMILTNSFAFAFGGRISIGPLADRIHENDIDILVGTKLLFENFRDQTFLEIK